jgi:hypothetical protein
MLELFRGDDNLISIIVKQPRVDPDTGEVEVDVYGNPISDPTDLTGGTLTFTARDRTKAVVLTVTSADAGGITIATPSTSGHASALISEGMTENLKAPVYLKYDVQLVSGAGVKTTVARGDAVVREDQTRG